MAHKNITFDFTDWHGPPFSCSMFLPDRPEDRSLVLFVMHGVERNARRYFKQWFKLAKKHRFVLIVPQFDNATFQSSRRYQLGNTLDRKGRIRPRSHWTFEVIERLFDHVKEQHDITAAKYAIYGHSAGGQFVHRMVMHVPHARIQVAIAANSGWYTLPTFGEAFPYGLNGSAVTPDAMKESFRAPLVLLLGSNDTDESSKWLRKTPDAMRQGVHRFERGHHFVEVAQREAAVAGVPCSWQVVVADGVGHVNRLIATHAVQLLAQEASLVLRSRQVTTQDVEAAAAQLPPPPPPLPLDGLPQLDGLHRASSPPQEHPEGREGGGDGAAGRQQHKVRRNRRHTHSQQDGEEEEAAALLPPAQAADVADLEAAARAAATQQPGEPGGTAADVTAEQGATGPPPAEAGSHGAGARGSSAASHQCGATCGEAHGAAPGEARLLAQPESQPAGQLRAPPHERVEAAGAAGVAGVQGGGAASAVPDEEGGRGDDEGAGAASDAGACLDQQCSYARVHGPEGGVLRCAGSQATQQDEGASSDATSSS